MTGPSYLYVLDARRLRSRHRVPVAPIRGRNVKRLVTDDGTTTTLFHPPRFAYESTAPSLAASVAAFIMPTTEPLSEMFSPATAVGSAATVTQVGLHPCLQVPELVDMIFRWLGEDPVYAPMTLNSLARTCHWFLEPALDVLWSNLPSIGPLICVLPEDAWSKEKNRPPARNTVVCTADSCTLSSH